MKTLLLVLILLLLPVYAYSMEMPAFKMHLDNPTPTPGDDDLREKLDEYMDRLVKRGFSGGLLVAKEGTVILSEGYGMAYREGEIPFSNETVFPVGSIAKQFTGAAILKLEMQGKLRVDDLMSTYLDGVPDDKADITLHHLLTHSAGFDQALGYDFAEISRADYLTLAMDASLMFEPGTSYAYTNVGYSLLAAIVERLSGQSFDAYVQKHLFGPAEMEKTGYVLSRWDKDDFARGYRGDEEWGSFADKAWAEDGPYWHLRGNGGILSTLGDMYQWHLALEDEAVLSEAAKQKFYAPHVQEGDMDSYYGYGWTTRQTSRGTLIAHNGGNPYFSNDFLRYVDANVVIYMTSNTSEHRASRLARTIADIVFGDPYELPSETIETLSEADLATLPIGRHTKAYLDVLASGSETAARQFVEDHFAAQVLENYDLEDLVDQVVSDQKEMGAVNVAKIVKDGEHSLELTVQSKASLDWWMLRLRAEPEAPHKLMGLGVMDTMPPQASTGAAPMQEQDMIPPPQGNWSLPDSPTGRAASALLDAVQHADAAVHQQFIEAYFEPGFRDEFSIEDHLQYFKQMHTDLKDVEVVGAQKTSSNTARITVQSNASGQRFSINLELSTASPHRITGIGIRAAD